MPAEIRDETVVAPGEERIYTLPSVSAGLECQQKVPVL
jgi:hypothetical protein